jgi:YebC/PmpR family DNA-binding regulatory protein
VAGHSKWANTKHRKAKQDAKKAKVFTKMIREITVSSRIGGPDPSSNPRLRKVVQEALGQNMTRDTIDRAIKRGAGGDGEAQYESLRYEGYGVSGVAFMVDCLTDNRNRTVGEVRHAFTKCGGNLGTDGSVSFMFNERGILSFAPGSDEDKIMDLALECGAEDVISNEDGSIDVFTAASEFHRVCEIFEQKGLKPDLSEVSFIPSVSATLDFDAAEKIVRLIDMLEDLDDVQKVYHNADISEEILEKIG